MGQSSNSFHEATDTLKPETMDRHRAIVSLMEELEAVDWYDQRIDAAKDAELRAILAHNRDEEKEQAAMVLEWLRRRDGVLDEQLRKYLFTTTSIVAKEEGLKGEGPANSAGIYTPPGIGSLRKRTEGSE